VHTLRKLGFSCSFTTVVGYNERGADPYVLRRIDCNDVTAGRIEGIQSPQP
jgi:hypothetical protein